MEIQLIRHATLILHIHGKKILVDPVLSPKGVISAIKNVPNTDNNPLVDLPLPVDSIINCDAVLITHTHRDHFDDAAKQLLPKDIPLFCQPEDEMKIKELGFTNIIAAVDSLIWGEIRIYRTKGRHGHGIIAKKMAPVSGFIVSAPGEPCIYLMGDTVWCAHVKSSIKKFTPDVAVSFSGEAKFSKGRAITMNARDILALCRKSPYTRVVAVHMEAWNHCRLSRKALRDFFIRNGIDRQVFIPENGETLSFSLYGTNQKQMI